MTPEERRAHLQRIAPLGGRARAAQLTPTRRRAIARLGFQALVTRRFGGDRTAAREGLSAKGLATRQTARLSPAASGPSAR